MECYYGVLLWSVIMECYYGVFLCSWEVFRVYCYLVQSVNMGFGVVWMQEEKGLVVELAGHIVDDIWELYKCMF